MASAFDFKVDFISMYRRPSPASGASEPAIPPNMLSSVTVLKSIGFYRSTAGRGRSSLFLKAFFTPGLGLGLAGLAEKRGRRSSVAAD